MTPLAHPSTGRRDASTRSGHAGRLIGIGLAVVVAYVVAAKIGFQFAFVAEQVTTVWAPSGIGLAALLLWGQALWPAIWLGAFVANVGTDVPWWAAATVATGNTLEAVAGAWALRTFARFDVRLRRIRDVLAFILVGAAAATTLSATIGVASLCMSGVQPWSRGAALWWDWWLGDAVGALIVAPVILTAGGPLLWSRRDWAEAWLVVTGSMIATHLIFGQVFGTTRGYHPLEYVIFPFVIAAAVRSGQPLTSIVVLASSGMTIWHTVRGSGPFASPLVHDSLILLQVFMGVLAGTGLLLAAAIAERETGERRRAAASAVGEVLAGAADLTMAASEILRVICEHLEWQVGAFWLVGQSDQRLRCLAVWTDDDMKAPAFAAMTRDTAFTIGIGLPGRVLETAKPAWIENVVEDSNFPRALVAEDAGLHGAFGFPICLDQRVLGVIECFNRTVVPPDADLLQTMSSVGNQIGQFIARKREEAAVVEEQRRTSAVLDTALDAVIGMDSRGRITAFNQAAVRTFGYSRDVALGRDLAELLIPQALRQKHREGLGRYLSTRVGTFIDRRVETVGYHADGHKFPVEIAITCVSDGDSPTFTGFVRDLTARAQAEREREQLLVREATARQEAEAANRAKDEFLATLSHELRTPLNAIVGWTRMLLDGTMDPRSTTRALQVIDRNAHLQARLVADILDVSHIITGGLRLEKRPVDLATVIGAALDAVRPAADAKNVQLRSVLTTPASVTEGDPQRLQQIVWNLLSNAVKFTEPAGTVTVELLEFPGAGSRGSLIRVSDDGAGIDPDFLPHVFDRFRQADGSVSRQYGGLGLGLAIVRHLVELHGGTVRATSPGIGKGAVFTIELPGMPAGDAITARSETSSGFPADRWGELRPMALSGYRLLVVDDQQDSLDLLAAILTGAGAEVETAASVSEALGKLSTGRPHALLADIGMPGADGYALIREVRNRDAQAGTHLPTAAITAYAGDADRTQVMAAGFDCHVPKPVNRSQLVEAIVSISHDTRPTS